jgi:NADH:ubiquinone oxidoreductase subunit E
MSLPIAPGPKSPNRASTHRAIPFDKLASIGMQVEEVAEDDVLSMDALLQLSAEQGKPPSHYIAAAVLSTDVQLEQAHEVTLTFCAGVCQQWGALECMDHAVDLYDRRREAGQPLFAVQAKKCLDRCADAAVLELRSPAGNTVVTMATPAKIDEALAVVLGAE